MVVKNHKTEIGPRARVTYHATVLSGVRVGEQGMVGSMGVASKDVSPYHIVGGIPANPIKVKSIAPEELPWALESGMPRPPRVGAAGAGVRAADSRGRLFPHACMHRSVHEIDRPAW